LLHRDARVKDVCEEKAQRTQRTLRQVGLGGQILSDLAIHRIRLLTNTPTHVPALQGFGIEIVEQVRVPVDGVTVS
jgi:3,4-dihydroxy 2-butanone 4-phosphate synthase/GTP cyclohydrolase II